MLKKTQFGGNDLRKPSVGNDGVQNKRFRRSTKHRSGRCDQKTVKRSQNPSVEQQTIDSRVLARL